MSAPRPSFVANPPIGRHGVIGDRRTAAMVAADGTLDWFCAPEFDGEPVFGSLLDVGRGGFCRLGPEPARLGAQRYAKDTAMVRTTWPDDADVELADIMAWPGDERAASANDQRVILRRLRAYEDAAIRFDLRPRRGFASAPLEAKSDAGGGTFHFQDGTLGFWASFPVEMEADGAMALLRVQAGDEHWVALGWNLDPRQWSVERARSEMLAATQYWRDWSSGLQTDAGGERARALQRAALTVQLLSHVEHDCAVAAVTTSLPERIGGSRNYDYRFAWVRDASLAMAFLARMGRSEEVAHYMEWLCSLPAATGMPLQVCYRLNGDPHLDPEEIPEACGYRNSKPVNRGNRAAKQRQLGSLGFLADCAQIYLEQGGEWRGEFWELIQRIADFTCDHWQEEDSGVWELAQEAHYVASRVMSWVVLDRASDIALRTDHDNEADRWTQCAATIHAEVMDKGWCAEKRSFRQRYGSDALDAALLLIPLMDFLPADHPRVASTLEALERELVVDGLIHRFNPTETLGGAQLPIGEFEGAFLPCVFWHAHALAKADRRDEAEAILRKCEAIAGDLGLFAEEADARQEILLGNTPLLFSHVEYARAAMELHAASLRAGSNIEMIHS
jgi:GH15 family glucan-1,4-alpha-glucosidase